MLSLADDSGLEVHALGGRPGVRSARFAGEAASDEENNERLLAELALVPNPERTARFRCVMALAVPGGDVHHVAGSSEGVILQAPRGSGGFGYDPLFAVPELGGSSFAELSAAQKDAVSHRGKALTKLRVLLLNQLSSQ
jgi:XTP/dITP diphosphohydrolase